eukprot:202907-Chlamydomonas_euryale.AAC.1
MQRGQRHVHGDVCGCGVGCRVGADAAAGADGPGVAARAAAAGRGGRAGGRRWQCAAAGASRARGAVPGADDGPRSLRACMLKRQVLSGPSPS